MSTIDELKKQALDELKNETNADQQKEAITEVIAEIITFEALQTRLASQAYANNQIKLKELFAAIAATKIIEDQLALHAQVNELLNNTKSQTLQLANGLPKYFLLNEGGASYLVPVPAQVRTASKSTGTRTPSQFASGDFIYLLSKDGQIKSQVYQVTGAGLVGQDDHEVYKASKAVEAFMVNQMGKVLPEGFAGYPGLSHPFWRKVTK